MAEDKRTHRVTMAANGMSISGWSEYEFGSSLIEPSQQFSLRMPFSLDAWRAFPRDSEVRIFIDGNPVMVGYVDERKKRSKEATLEISGRDKAGRLVQESAPEINYTGLSMLETAKRLVSPWFSTVTLSDVRNRRVRMGKGIRIPGVDDDVTIQIHGKQQNPNNPFGSAPNPFAPAKGGSKIHPGESRWKTLEEIMSQLGLIGWASADGREFFLGYPDQDQPPTFVCRLAVAGSGNATTVKELDYEESNGDRYSLIAVVGTGGGTDDDYGEPVATRRGVVYDNPGNKSDGTGRDFLKPKRLLMPEGNYSSNDEAIRQATLEQWRRDFRRTSVTITMPTHGQFVDGAQSTLFAPNTIAWVVDEELDGDLDGDYLIYDCRYRCSRKEGETTLLRAVPRGTMFTH